VPLTLIAGAGHWLLGSVDFVLLGSLLLGSVPGIVIGSLIATRIPDRVLRPVLAGTLAIVGGRLVF
ncbi:TSUP family transporter, partial [Acinetobacter baumannii]|uniref:TSUP family transporter n=2 Tax=Pseudomonadota TaxID=1224 RepID=UPI0037D6244A